MNERSTLVVGYGNVLRSDDGVGPRIAEAIAALRLPDVRVVVTHQLTPELAESLSEVHTAVFVDAYAGESGNRVEIRPLHPGTCAESVGHTGDPRALLALTQALFGVVPAAFWVLVPGDSFEVGEHLSTAASEGMVVAVDLIRNLLCDRGAEASIHA